MQCYLDNCATTKICHESQQAMMETFSKFYGNASSLHTKGYESELAILEAKQQIAKAVGAKREEIIFTSGGTESNNLAIFGAVEALKRRGKRIVTTEIEHSSVSEPMSVLEKRGFEVIRVKPLSSGAVSVDDFRKAINKDTILVSTMLINNETGAVLPVPEIAAIAKKAAPNALIHCDAVQAFGKVPIDVTALGVQLMSLSAHKLHGPKGIGALYIKDKTRIVPLFYGGGQEKGIRAGTEPVALIRGFSAAVNALPDLKGQLKIIAGLKQRLLDGLEKYNFVHINSHGDSVPYIVNFSVMGIKSQTMLNFLSERGIYVSSGSACSKGKISRALLAQGLSRDRADSAIRVSFSRFSTERDVDYLLDGIEKATKTLQRKK